MYIYENRHISLSIRICKHYTYVYAASRVWPSAHGQAPTVQLCHASSVAPFKVHRWHACAGRYFGKYGGGSPSMCHRCALRQQLFARRQKRYACVCVWVGACACVCVCVCVCVSVGVHSTARAADRLVEHCSTVIWFFNAPVVSSVRSTYSSLRMRTIQA